MDGVRALTKDWTVRVLHVFYSCILVAALSLSFVTGSHAANRSVNGSPTPVNANGNSAIKAVSAAATKHSISVASSDGEIEQTIDNLTKDRNMKALVDLQKHLSELLSQNESSRFALLSLRICNALSTFDFHDPSQYSLSSELALGTLEKVGDSCSLLNQLDLARHLRASDSEGRLKKDIADRARYLKIWLVAVNRLEEEAAKSLNPSDEGSPNEILPGFESVLPFAGASPAAIKDPNVRSKYDAALEARNAKESQYRITNIAQHRKPLYIKYFQDFLQTAFKGIRPEVKSVEISNALSAIGLSPEDQSCLLKDIQ